MKKSKVFISNCIYVFNYKFAQNQKKLPVEVFYDDVTNEQMFLNIKNNVF